MQSATCCGSKRGNPSFVTASKHAEFGAHSFGTTRKKPNLGCATRRFGDPVAESGKNLLDQLTGHSANFVRFCHLCFLCKTAYPLAGPKLQESPRGRKESIPFAFCICFVGKAGCGSSSGFCFPFRDFDCRRRCAAGSTRSTAIARIPSLQARSSRCRFSSSYNGKQLSLRSD